MGFSPKFITRSRRAKSREEMRGPVLKSEEAPQRRPWTEVALELGDGPQGEEAASVIANRSRPEKLARAVY
jgi:hypothetical protein